MRMFTTWRSIGKAALLGGAALLTASQAGAAEPVRLGYAIYAGGFHVLDASIVLDVGREGYMVEVNAQTQGILGTFFPWQTLARSDGRMNAGEAEPRTHKQTGTWRGKDRAVDLYYDGSGSVLAEVRPPDDPAEREPVPPEMVPGTTDPLSAVLSVAGAVAVGRGCSETVPVFDGRRRYDLTFKEMGSRNLPPSKYSVFSGAAVQCQVTSKVLAGNWKKDGGAVSNDEKRKPVALMLAPVVEGMPPVPVRLEGESRFGEVIMHLTSAEPIVSSGAVAQ
ncbi:hypothetical protein SAE02_11030 [Skermanella aerolata]|uniref:DUF3108 domain-containing protein n=2 Tax=Skermanella aerolata TaxID=393310 RepID=A0A512DKI3_9PROT|nr:hypothetical protein SAE02_11030 [Skermanella aerolata]